MAVPVFQLADEIQHACRYCATIGRANLRRFFEVDAELTVIATLYALAEKGELEKKVVEQAIKDLNVAPEKAHAALI